MLYNGFLFALGSDGVSWKYMFSGNVRGMSAKKKAYQFLHSCGDACKTYGNGKRGAQHKIRHHFSSANLFTD